MIKLRINYLILLCVLCIFTAACTNVTPLTPETPNTAPTPTGQNEGSTVIYNYTDSGPVQLSKNNITLKVGEKLVLQPAAGLTSNTRFTSSGEYFWGNIMEQVSPDSATTNATFTAIKPGKGKLTIIPNGTETDRQADLWATVQ